MSNGTIRVRHRLRKAKLSEITSSSDFIVDWTAPGYFGDGPVMEVYWTIHCDGA